MIEIKICRIKLFHGLHDIVYSHVNNKGIYGEAITVQFLRKYHAIPFKEEVRNDEIENFEACFSALVSLYGEICAIRELIVNLGIDKNKISVIEEQSSPTPDFKVELNNKITYIEVYTPVLQDIERSQTQDELLNRMLSIKTFRQFRDVEENSESIIMVLPIGKINLAVWSSPSLVANYMDSNPLKYSDINQVYLCEEPNFNQHVIVYGHPFVENMGSPIVWCNDVKMKMKLITLKELNNIIVPK